MEGIVVLILSVILLSAWGGSFPRNSISRREPNPHCGSSAGSIAKRPIAEDLHAPTKFPARAKAITSGFQPEDRCPCGGSWVKKENSQTGGRFFHCSRFPSCRLTRDEVIRKRMGSSYKDHYCPRGHHKESEGIVTDPATGKVLCKKCVDKGYVRLSTAREELSRVSHVVQSGESQQNMFCRNGHPRSPENTYLRPDGSRECAVCRRNARRRRE